MSSQPRDLPWDDPGRGETTSDPQPRDDGGRGGGRRARSRSGDADSTETSGAEPRSWDRADASGRVTPGDVLEYTLDGDAEVQLVLGRCAVLRELVEQAERENSLSNDEAVVVVYSLGHLTTGPRAVNTVLRRCLGVDPSMYLKSRLRGSPISCPKIRMRIPHVTARVPCNCEFDPEAGSTCGYHTMAIRNRPLIPGHLRLGSGQAEDGRGEGDKRSAVFGRRA